MRRADGRWRRRGRTLLVLWFCAGIAGLGLLSGGEQPRARADRDPMTGYYPVGMPRYPNAREFPAGETRLGGATMKSSHFTTADDPATVADFYRRHWRKRRFFVRDDVTHRGGTISAVDGAHGRIYQLLLVVQGRQTMVFPSVVDNPAGLKMRGTKSPLPLLRGTEVLSNLTTTAGSRRARIVLATHPGTLADNLKHYRAALRAAGLRPESDKSDGARLRNKRVAGQRLLVYIGDDGREITVALSPLGPKQGTRVQILAVSTP